MAHAGRPIVRRPAAVFVWSTRRIPCALAHDLPAHRDGARGRIEAAPTQREQVQAPQSGREQQGDRIAHRQLKRTAQHAASICRPGCRWKGSCPSGSGFGNIEDAFHTMHAGEVLRSVLVLN
jgi:hypothetical protein